MHSWVVDVEIRFASTYFLVTKPAMHIKIHTINMLKEMHQLFISLSRLCVNFKKKYNSCHQLTSNANIHVSMKEETGFTSHCAWRLLRANKLWTTLVLQQNKKQAKKCHHSKNPYIYFVTSMTIEERNIDLNSIHITVSMVIYLSSESMQFVLNTPFCSVSIWPSFPLTEKNLVQE